MTRLFSHPGENYIFCYQSDHYEGGLYHVTDTDVRETHEDSWKIEIQWKLELEVEQQMKADVG